MSTISIPQIPSVDFFNAIASPETYSKDWVNWILGSYHDAEGVWILEDSLDNLQVIDAKKNRILGVIRDKTDYFEPMQSQSVIATPWGEAFNYYLLVRSQEENA